MEQPLHRQLGLTDGELDRIVTLLEREPNHFELAVFSLLWSEHCGYKHSALLLRRLPSEGPRVLQGPGENAGVLDLGDGLAVAFKVESHNHPSAVEPFQGAATGVGGILRDISAMGARPIALLDGLRFGAPDDHFSRAVGGVGHYGNCVGVPNVGGEVVFDDSYASNCLVNAMCVGLLPADRLTTAKATAVGAHVLVYGATTGRDGIGGASVLASAELGEADADKRPSVQVGDPFTGKRLIEVSVELVERGLVLSLQDCGAAGLASSLSEMAAETGIDVHLDRVPFREEGMEPWEVMISESQERMVAVVADDRLAEVEAVVDRWELHRAVIGEVTDSGVLRALWHGEEVGAIPARFLTDECPRYVVERTAACAPTRGSNSRSADGDRARRAARVTAAPLARVRHAPLRPARAVAHRPPPRSRRGRPAPASRPRGSRAHARRSGQGRLPRPARRRDARDPRGGAERRLRRRRADRLHRLPQLREPREAGDRLGARRVDRGDGARLRGARRSDRLGQRLALQRHRRSLDPPDSRGRVRRDDRGRPPRAGALEPRRRRARGPLGEPAHARRDRRPRRSTGPAAASRGSISPRRSSSCASRPRSPRARRSSTTSPRAASRSRWPRRRSGATSASSLDVDDDPVALFGEVGGQVVFALPSDQVEVDPTGADVQVRRIGTVGGDEVLGVRLAELRAAYEGMDA